MGKNFFKGFTTIEEGEVTGGNKISLKLVNIGRISWGRDLPVLDVHKSKKYFVGGAVNQNSLLYV